MRRKSWNSRLPIWAFLQAVFQDLSKRLTWSVPFSFRNTKGRTDPDFPLSFHCRFRTSRSSPSPTTVLGSLFYASPGSSLTTSRLRSTLSQVRPVTSPSRQPVLYANVMKPRRCSGSTSRRLMKSPCSKNPFRTLFSRSMGNVRHPINNGRRLLSAEVEHALQGSHLAVDRRIGSALGDPFLNILLNHGGGDARGIHAFERFLEVIHTPFRSDERSFLVDPIIPAEPLGELIEGDPIEHDTPEVCLGRFRPPGFQAASWPPSSCRSPSSPGNACHCGNI